MHHDLCAGCGLAFPVRKGCGRRETLLPQSVTPTHPIMSRTTLFLGAVLALGLAACSDDVSSPMAPATALKAAPVPVPAVCATVTVTNTGQTVKNFNQPEIKYNVANCGSTALNVTVSVIETTSAWSEPCPSPVAAPVKMALGVNAKVSSSFPTYRGPCGFTGPVNGTLVQGVNRWQGHNLLVLVTNDADGAVLGSGFFSWQDQTPRV